MNTEHLHLFTPVSEGLPEDSEWHFVIFVFDNKEQVGFAMLDTWGTNERRFWNIRGAFIGTEPFVTHWLDLSKLTTIERAVEFAELSFVAGHKYCQEGREGQNFYKFIQQNKNKI